MRLIRALRRGKKSIASCNFPGTLYTTTRIAFANFGLKAFVEKTIGNGVPFMRKDMRFAWAAGGLLVAVMAIYLIVAGTSGRNKNSQPVELVTEGPAATEQKAPAPAVVKTPPPAEPGAAQASAAPQPTAEPKAKSDVWGALLTTGHAPAGMLMTETPQANAPVTSQAQPGAVSSASMQSTDSSDIADTGDTDTAAPPNAAAAAPAGTGAVAAAAPENAARPSTGSTKHVVQSGETFSTIAAKAYGNAAYWGHIARANPNIDSRHLKVGMVLTLPDPAQVTAGASTHATPTPDKVDSSKQYRVQANDNLYKISMKLYHSAKYVDKIYDLNKQAIGPNPAHLKLNMVLQLPETPR
jgi:nucleoid-associated protein YgaU